MNILLFFKNNKFCNLFFKFILFIQRFIIFQNIQRESTKKSQEQRENDKLSDQKEQNRLIEYIQQKYNKWNIESTNNINLIQIKDGQIDLNTFEYNQSSEDDYFIIMNMVQIIDKLPKEEVQQNKAKKYDINNPMIFLDILSKQVLTRDMMKLKDDVNVMFTYFVAIAIIVFICILIFTVLRAIIISLSLIRGLDHLTRVLSKIKWETGEEGELQFIDIIDENLKTESLFLSKDMKILYESFQNLFKTLHYTTSNIYSEDDGHNLLNLNIQTQYFKQFQNFRALGVCINNMGNIHLNSCRYFEAMECYQKAIVYSHYDLGSYIERSYSSEYNSRFSYQERSIYSRDPSTSKYECRSDKTDRSEREIYSWNLFNRKLNYFKAFIAYLNNQQDNNLWSCGENLIDELLYISKTTLFKCYSRNIILLYYKSITLFQQGKTKAYQKNMEKAILKFNKYYNLKNQNMNLVAYNPSLILNSQPSRFQYGQQNNKYKTSQKQNIYNQISSNQLNPNYNKIQSPSINLQSGIRFSTKDKAFSNLSNSRLAQNSINNDNIPKTLVDIPYLYNSKVSNEIPFSHSYRENINPSTLQKTSINNNLGHEYKNKHKQNYATQQNRGSSLFQYNQQMQIKQTLPASFNFMKKQKSKQEIGSKKDILNSLINIQTEDQVENEIINKEKQMVNIDLNPQQTFQNIQIITNQNLNELEKKTPSSNLQLLDTYEFQPLPQNKQILTQEQNNLTTVRRPGSILQTNQCDSSHQTEQQHILMLENSINNKTVSQNEIRKRESSLIRGYKIFTKAFFSSSPSKSKKKKRSLHISRSETKIKSVSEFKKKKNNSFFSKMNFKISLQKLKQFFKKAKEEQIEDENNVDNNNAINAQNNNSFGKNDCKNLNIMQENSKNLNNKYKKRDSNKPTQNSFEYKHQNHSLINQYDKFNNSRKKSKMQTNTSNYEKQSSKTTFIGQQRQGDQQNQSILSIDKNIFQGLQVEQIQVSKVKKYLNDEQISRQILPPDVLQAFVIVQQAELLILKKDYYLACQILTDQLQDQKIYLQHIRFRMLRLLKKVLNEVNLISPDIDLMIDSLQQSSIFKIQFVSGCTLQSSLTRSYKLLVNVKEELIKKDQDQLGLIVYNRDDQIFSQEIFMMSNSQLKRASSYTIDYLLKSVYREYSYAQQQQILKQTNEQNNQIHSKLLNCDQLQDGEKTKFTKFGEHDDSMFEYQEENSFNQQQVCSNIHKGNIINNNFNDNVDNVKNNIANNIKYGNKISSNKDQIYNNNSISNLNLQSIAAKNMMTEQTDGITPFSKKLLGENKKTIYNNFNPKLNQNNQKQKGFINIQNESSLYQFESVRLNQSACDYGIDKLDGITTIQTPNDKMKSSTTNLQIKKRPYIFNTSEVNLSGGQLKEENSRSPLTILNKRHFFQDYEFADQKYDIKKTNKIGNQHDQEIKNNQMRTNSLIEINDQSKTNNNNIKLLKVNSNEEIFNNQIQSYSSRRIQLEYGLSQNPSPQSKISDDFCLNQNKKSIFKNSIDVSIEKRDLFNSNLGSAIENNLLFTPFETPMTQKNLQMKDKFTFVNSLQNEDFISPGSSQKEIQNLILFNQKSENKISFGSENYTPTSRRQSSNRHQNPKCQQINLTQINESNNNITINNKKNDEISQKQLFTEIQKDQQQINLDAQINEVQVISNSKYSKLHQNIDLRINTKKILSKRNSTSISPDYKNEEEMKKDNISKNIDDNKNLDNSPNRNRMYSFQAVKKASDKIDPNDKDLIFNTPGMNSQNDYHQSPAFLPLQGLKTKDQSQNSVQLDNTSSSKDTITSSVQITTQKLDPDRNHIFHLGIQKAISSLLLPNQEQQTYSYISQIYKNNQKTNQYDATGQKSQSASKPPVFNQDDTLYVQKYIIFVTDQLGVSQNNILFKQLCNMLRNSGIVLLILQLNSLAQIEESSISEDIYENGKCVIKYFYSQNKLLQYIYSQRQSFNSIFKRTSYLYLFSDCQHLQQEYTLNAASCFNFFSLYYKQYFIKFFD